MSRYLEAEVEGPMAVCIARTPSVTLRGSGELEPKK